MLRIGIEQEFVFRDGSGRYLDAENSDYAVFEKIVDQFPALPGDDDWFECKSLEQYPKRCYVEGFERHDRDGRLIETIPKGLEIRTLPHRSVRSCVDEFRRSYGKVMGIAADSGLFPVLTSRHPFKSTISLESRIGSVEGQVRTEAELALATRAMLSHGLHVNVSIDGYDGRRMQDLLEKVNYYMPVMIPWTFSSPFLDGDAFEGLCSRNYCRADSRRMADIHSRSGCRILEFRGFDACGDFRLLTAVLRFFRGFLLDHSLPGRSARQDSGRLKLSSLRGFSEPSLKEAGLEALNASRSAMGGSRDTLDLLEEMLVANDSYAARMKASYQENGDIVACISDRYDF
jgi:hypothetical protein